LNIDSSQIISIDRYSNNQQLNTFIPTKNQHRVNWDDYVEIENFVSDIFRKRFNESLLVLNFMGDFGQIESIKELDIGGTLQTNSKNLLPFFLIAKLSNLLPANTKVISFSGAGVGGDNQDDSSFGYLAAKSSMVFLTESIDKQLSKYGVRFGLVAPGAFPSRMQEAVATYDSKSLPVDRVSRARQVMTSSPSAVKLAKMIHFLSENPELLGGRTWSANFDDHSAIQGNFGKMRRVY
jgi:NAD(P)-dependent dehydrogenase (short-subunit alcohol dehydrogenase family)